MFALAWLPVFSFSQVGNRPETDSVEISIPSPDSLILYEKEPVPVNLDEIKQQIGYPSAPTNDLFGTYVFRVLVDEQGEYVQHIVKKGEYQPMVEKLGELIPQVRFSPAIQGGKPVKAWTTLPFTFCP